MRSIRVSMGLTQEKLAWDCDLANAYLSQVESGQRLPSVEVLDRLAARLEVPLAELFSGEAPTSRGGVKTRE